MNLFHRRPFRCRNCRRRFYAREDERPEIGRDETADHAADRRA